jgi:DNA-binding transcriptional LysR family regulator
MVDFAFRARPSQLRLILELHQHRQLQLAANRLSITQPAASRMLAEIETTAGGALFVRHPKGMEPTQLGEAFAKRAKLILTELGNLDDELEQLTSGTAGSVRVGAVTGPAVRFLVPAVQRIKQETPKVEITFEISPSTHLLRELQTGNLEFVLARLTAEFDAADFRIRPARNEVISLVVRSGHPLATARRVQLADLPDYSWIIQERASPIRVAMEDAFLNSGLKLPDNVINSSSLLAMIAFLSQTDIIAPLSQEVAGLLTGAAVGAKLVVLQLDREIEVTPYYLIENKATALSPLAQRLFDQVLREMGRDGAA